MKLDVQEIDSAAWRKVREYIHTEIDKELTALEKDRAEIDTANRRGRIRAFRLVLAMEAKAAPPQPLEAFPPAAQVPG